MNKNNKDKFVFWMPAEIEKAKKDTDEKPVMRMKGIASGLARDSDGEFLEPEGFDLEFFLSGGMVNWHHQAKVDPMANIGEPEVAKIVPEGLYVECLLYEGSKLATGVYELAELLEKNSKTRRLGFSIEGKVLERDPLDDTRITKAKITGLAITHIPKNPATLCEIMKGERDGFDMEWDELDGEDEKKPKKKKEAETEEEAEKALSTSTGAALMTESVEGDPKRAEDDKEGENDENNRVLTKGEVFKRIFDNPDISISKAKQVYRIIEKTSENMNNGQPNQITNAAIEKAYDILGISDEFQKGEAPTVGSNGGGRTENPRTRGGNTTTYYRELEKGGEYELMTKGEAEDGSQDTRADEKIYIKKGEDFVEKSEEATSEAPANDVEKGQENELGSQSASTAINKGFGAEEVGELMKGMLNEFEKGNTQMFKAIGTILQGVAQNQNAILDRLAEYEQQPVSPRKSIQNISQVDRFSKGQDNEFGGQNNSGQKQVSISQERGNVIALMNSVTFAKGEIDMPLANALATFEASGLLPAPVRQKIQQLTQVQIVD